MPQATASDGSCLKFKEVATQPGQRPDLPRSGHCTAVLPAGHSHDLIMFGGYVEEPDKGRRPTNDAWLFALADGKWSRVQYASQQVPRARLASQAVVVGNQLWVMGGWDSGDTRTKEAGPGDILADLWALDLESYTWAQVQPEGETLQPISRFQAVAVGQQIYIHTHRSLEDILVLDVATAAADGAPPRATLRRLPVSGKNGTPSSRGLHSLTAIGRTLYLFGGAPQRGGMLNDLWTLDLDSLEWRQLHPEGDQPHVRCSHGAAAVGAHLCLWAGAFYKSDGSGLQNLDDFIALDTTEEPLRWRSPRLEHSPVPRNAHTMDALGQVLVVHGGWRAFVETYNDTHVVQYTLA